MNRQIATLVVYEMNAGLRRWQLYLAGAGTFVFLALFLGLELAFRSTGMMRLIPISPSFVVINLVSSIGVMMLSNVAAGIAQRIKEQKDGIWPLLSLTDVGFGGIFLSAVVPAVSSAIFVILMQIPLLALATVFGGPNWPLIFCGVLLISTHLAAVGCLAFFCSIRWKRPESGVSAILVFYPLLFALPSALRLLLVEFLQLPVSRPQEFDGLIKLVQIWSELCTIGCLIFPMTTIPFPYSFLLASFVNVLAAAVLALASKSAFEAGNRDLDWSPDIALPPRITRPVPPHSPPWSNALAWKDFVFVGGGVPMFISQAVFYALLWIIWLTWFGLEYAWGNGNSFSLIGVVPLAVFGILWLLVFGVLITFSMADEIMGNTLGMLLLLPYSPRELMYRKLGGALPLTIPVFVCLILSAFVYFTFCYVGNYGSFKFNIEWIAVTIANLLCLPLFLCHYGVLLVLSQKRTSFSSLLLGVLPILLLFMMGALIALEVRLGWESYDVVWQLDGWLAAISVAILTLIYHLRIPAMIEDHAAEN